MLVPINDRAAMSAPCPLPAQARRRLALVAVLLLAAAPAAGAAPSYLERPPEQEIIYFLLPDRFARSDAQPEPARGGDRLVTGYDPTDAKFYHGGSLRGIARQLGYIQALGATALWLAPVFVNQPVQGPPGHETAGYHGYWITDFMHVDPHFGTDADLHELVNAAHARGMKVYLDIVVNHTADVIRYRECPVAPCPYRSEAEYPYTRRGGISGAAINQGFLGLDGPQHQTEENFAHLTRPDYAYTPYLPAGEEHRKVPDWLNDPIYYHNRGDSTWAGESVTLGDFFGLDDVMTEHPRVVRGMIEIFGYWIEQYRIDGFRIDTEQHVNPEFWRAFVPAMRARAAAVGIRHFHLFGEVATDKMDTALLARHVREDGIPAVLDFAFAAAVRDTVAGNAGTDRLARLFADDEVYPDGAATARQLPTFVSNHDAGRFGYFVRRARPQIEAGEQLQRVVLAHALLLTLRGVPALYYGDEQGFLGDDGDAGARQDMFATRVEKYAHEARLGAATAGGGDHYQTTQPLYLAISELSHLRLAHPALSQGRQQTRAAADSPGLFAVSRFDPADGHEIVLAFNTSLQAIDALIRVDARSARFRALHGECAAQSAAPGSYRVRVPVLGYIVCEAEAGS
ncbi:MAG TPA: alpha-amylase family glycosyl hydrolase [Steroidobacteraceae bacterium]|nr:alpha-amylase family glycosyl hydrolase [Steroidobacteraceae bacterium]